MPTRSKVHQATKPHGSVNLGPELGSLVRFLAWYKQVSVAELLRPYLLKKLKAEFDELPDSIKARFQPPQTTPD